MKEHPILFSAPMVRAILAGAKTQTRRVIKPQLPEAEGGVHLKHKAIHPAPYYDAYCGARKTIENPRGMSGGWCWWTEDDRQSNGWRDCPYGVPGNRLWVRETWAVQTAQQPWSDGEWAGCYDGKLADAPHDLQPIYRAGCCGDSSIEEAMTNGGGWRPSIHMPRWASRLTLEIVSVRVERVQAISEADAKAEGIRDLLTRADTVAVKPATACFIRLWDSINAARGFGWDANPFVWVVEFKRVEQEPTPAHRHTATGRGAL